MTSEKAQAEIPYSLVEYTGTFEQPIIEAWEGPVLTPEVLRALQPYGFTIDGVEYKEESEKASDHAIVFRRTDPPTPGMNLSLGLGKVVITAENLDWSEAERFISAMDIALNAIFNTAQTKLKSQQLSVSIHIQLKNKPRKDVTMPLLSPAGSQIFVGEITCGGLILHVTNGHILIDASAGLANGVFVRLFREHPPQATFERLAQVLRRDEERVFEVLGLEGEL
jgi:hypothetical protein